MELRPFYWNFDGLEVTFQGRIPQELLDQMESAKSEAQNSRAAVLIEWRAEAMYVAEAGAKGGYAYRCDTGDIGATWFFSRNQSAKNWNIRVSLKSNALASMGLGGVRAELYRFLAAIGAEVHSASISRVDYCIDFLADDIEVAIGTPFTLDPNGFVMHSHTNRSDHNDSAGMQMHGVSGRYTSVTCGKMPGRQIIFYEKSREVRVRKKSEWWEHWKTARERKGLPPLTGEEQIWRVELRAGKTHLKERWGISSWEEMDDKLGDLFIRALKDIRYTNPSPTDSERSRWENHPLWSAVLRTVSEDLREMTCGAEPGRIRNVRRDQLAQTTCAMIKGLSATFSVATGTSPTPDTLADQVGQMVRTHLTTDAAKFEASRKRAAQRYRFLDERPGEKSRSAEASFSIWSYLTS